jgi:hypothetical protein
LKRLILTLPPAGTQSGTRLLIPRATVAAYSARARDAAHNLTIAADHNAIPVRLPLSLPLPLPLSLLFLEKNELRIEKFEAGD